MMNRKGRYISFVTLMPDLASIGKREREDVFVDKLNSEENRASSLLAKHSISQSSLASFHFHFKRKEQLLDHIILR